MKTYTEKIDITPHTSTMPKLSQTGYTLSQAVNELVDNSIDARTGDQRVSIDIVIDKKKGSISIVDNSLGMDKRAAKNCLRMGKSAKKNQLGEFGLGLKTAALSLGKTFKIATTQEGSNRTFVLEFDEDAWQENGDWTEFDMKINEGGSLKSHGTKVTITNLKNKLSANSQDILRKKLAVSFGAYINNGEVKISVNKKLCKPKLEELILTEERPNGKEKFSYTMEDTGETIHGWRGLLVKGAINDNGFRVYRNKRLIEEYQKIGFVQHAAFRHIIGELHLDHVPVTHNKREFIKASDKYQEVIKKDGQFWRGMESLRKEARLTARKDHEDHPEESEEIEHLMKNVYKTFNKIPELRQYSLPESEEMVIARGNKDNNDGKTPFYIEGRMAGEVVSVNPENSTLNGSKERKPKTTRKKNVYSIRVSGKNYSVTLQHEDLTDESLPFTKNIVDNKLVVYINIGFVGYKVATQSRDSGLYNNFIVSEALSELFLENRKNPEHTLAELKWIIFRAMEEPKLAEINEMKKEMQKLQDREIEKHS